MFWFAMNQADDGWRWSLTAAGGHVMAQSPRPYRKRSNCTRSIDRVKNALGGWNPPIIVKEAINAQ